VNKMAKKSGNKKDSKNDKKRNINLAIGPDFFQENGIPFSGKRATLAAIYYSLPSNQNATGSLGSTIIAQKVIPWGENAEPRVYISPFALKRRIRDYWIRCGQKVAYREDPELFDNKEAKSLDYIDNDLFGYMYAKESGKKERKQSADIRHGPINTWGAVSLEALHDFVDFNTSIMNVKGKDKMGGSIFNRQISKEFYFTSFFINPDLIAVDLHNLKDKNKESKKDIIKKKQERLKLFIEAVKYAMQKETGPRDRGKCVLLAIGISEGHYPTFDKPMLESAKVDENKVKIEIKNEEDENVHIVYYDKNFVEIKSEKGVKISNKKEGISKVVSELVGKTM